MKNNFAESVNSTLGLSFVECQRVFGCISVFHSCLPLNKNIWVDRWELGGRECANANDGYSEDADKKESISCAVFHGCALSWFVC